MEAHFATVNSQIVSMSRVEDTSQCGTKECTKARILALAEVRYLGIAYYCDLLTFAGWRSETTFTSNRTSHYNPFSNVFLTGEHSDEVANYPFYSSFLGSLHEQLLRDVVYSLKDSLLFVLLKTSEVIVFDATTNPCSARELLVAPSDKQLLSIALVSLSLSLSLSPLS